MIVLNSFRLTLLLVVAVIGLYNFRKSEPGPKRTRLGRAAISNWPGTTYPLPLLSGWTDRVDQKTVPALTVRKTNADPCGASDPGCTWSCTGCLAADDVKTCPDRNTLAMTFDDGPSPATPGLLDLLDKNNIKVTFFVVGTQLLTDSNKATLLRAYKAGHQIASHTWSHRALTTLSNEEIIAEIMWTHEIIKSVIGVSPTYLRPPFGDVDNRVRAIAKQLGYRVAIWSHDTFDWKLASTPTMKASDIADDFTKWINDQSRTLGMITLEHDLYADAVGAVPGALTAIQATKINLMTVAQCQGNNPYVEAMNATVSSQSAPSASSSSSSAGSTPSTPVNAPGGSGTTRTANDISSMAYFFVAAVFCIVVAF